MWYRLLQIRLLMGLLPALGLVLWAGIDGGGTYYEKSPAEIQKSLKSALVPTHVLGRYVVGSRVHTPDDATVITALLDKKGDEIMHFITKIEADGTGVNVQTSVEPPKGEHAEKVAKGLKENVLAAGLIDKLAQEHVAAAIEGRPFDMMFASPVGARQFLNNTPGMQEQIDAANAGASDYARHQQSAEQEIDTDYSDDSGGWGTESSGSDWGDESGGWGD